MILIILLLISVIGFALFKLLSVPDTEGTTLITGGIKTGKSLMSVYMSYKLARKKRSCIYSNIPLNIPKVKVYKLKKSHIMRQAKLPEKAIVYVCESALVLGSQDYKDLEINDQYNIFNKLIAHETYGGKVIFDTQSPLDNHYAVKRTLSEYISIAKSINIGIGRIQIYNIVPVSRMEGEDVHITPAKTKWADRYRTRYMLIPRNIYKMYDRYAYSAMTDDLPYDDELYNQNSLKQKSLVRFKESKSSNAKNS